MLKNAFYAVQRLILPKTALQLRERNKELRCLYDLSRILRNIDNDFDGTLRQCAARIPDAWMFPEIACAEMTVNGVTYAGNVFHKPVDAMCAPISAGGEDLGILRVGYLEKRPDAFEGPFLSEERDLLDGIASLLANAIECHRRRERLRGQLAAEKAIAGMTRALAIRGEDGMECVLGILGRALDVDRVSLFRFEPGMAVCDIVHEWLGATVQSQFANRRNLEVSQFPWWMERMTRGEMIWFENPENLPAEASIERRLLEAGRTRAFAAIPIVPPGGQLAGFIGLEMVGEGRPLSANFPRLLCLAGDLIGRHWERETSRRLTERREMLYRRAIEVANAVPYYRDYVTGRYEFIGNGIEKLTGVPAEKFTPDALGAVTEETRLLDRLEGMELDQAISWAIGSPDQVWRAEYRMRDAAGGDRWVRDSAIQQREGEGPPVGSLGILQDITEYKRIERSLREQLSLNAFLAELRASAAGRDELGETLQACAETAAKRVPGVALARIWLMNPAGDELVLKASAGMYRRLDGGHARVPFGKFKIGKIASASKTHIVNDIESDPDFHDHDWIRKNQLRAFAGLPLLAGGERFGVLGLFSRQPFSNEAAATLETAAGEIAVAAERIQSQTDLVESEARLRQIIDLVPHWIYAKDEFGRYILVNKACAEAMGAAPADIVGQSMHERVPERDDAAKFYRDDLKVIRSGEPLFIPEETMVCADGAARLLQTTKIPFTTQRGGVRAVLGISVDITESRRLREERDRFFTLSKDLFAVVGFDGYFKEINPAWSQTLGWPLEDLRKKHWTELVHPDDLDRSRRANAELLEGNQLLSYENRFLQTNGEYRWISWNAIPLPAEALIFAAGRDITDYVEAETDREHLRKQLLHAHKMEAVGRLAGGVAHDFNNLLMVINCYCDLAMDAIGDSQPVMGYLEEIRKAGDKSSNLTRQLLAFSRKQILQPRRVELNELVSETEKMLHRILGEDIHLGIHPSPVPVCVEADPGQIEQIVMNLAVNARDAMPSGGRLAIETRLVELNNPIEAGHQCEPGAYASLTVTDNGCGIPTEIQERIFEPFFTTKEQGKGTGLGLSTIYGIVKQSGGSISVCSEPGRGSAFEILLPAADGNDCDSKETGEVEMNAKGSETILLIEDDEMVRTIVSIALRKYGYNVIENATGEEALSRFKERNGKVDLVLTDVVMPGMNGRELMERLRAQSPDVKVLFMSGYTHDALEKQDLRIDEIEFVHKPVAPAELLKKIRRILHP